MRARKTRRIVRNRNGAIGLIVLCIAVPALLIAARTSEPTTASAATAAVTTEETRTIAARDTAPVNTPTALAPAAKPQTAEAGTAAPAAEAVTVEGCLVQEDQTFHLKNTSGEDAPKGRSWKTGFLHRGSKTVDVVDGRHRLNLARHVGERVVVTGMLDDRELQGTSLKRIAESCS